VGTFQGSAVMGPKCLKNAGEAVGKKAPPILQIHALQIYAMDSSKISQYMRESGDIVKHVDQLTSYSKLAPASGRPDIAAWKKLALKTLGPLTTVHKLHTEVADWAHAEDIHYAQQKYAVKSKDRYFVQTLAGKMGPRGMGAPQDVLCTRADTAQLLQAANSCLQEFDQLLDSEASLSPGGVHGHDDLMVVPTLRNFTCVPGVEWPPRTRRYLEAACASADVDLYEPRPLPDGNVIPPPLPSLELAFFVAAVGSAVLWSRYKR
jgi:glutaredoxin 2